MNGKDRPLTVNYQAKNIREMQPGDTIYVHRGGRNDPGHLLFCDFVEFKRGLVVARVRWVNPHYLDPCGRQKGQEIRARYDKCALWGVPEDSDPKDRHDRWCWFRTPNLKAGE